jgi:hypothetical protein
MDNRYSLRFETGERAGETIPIQGQGFTVGRRPGHSLQILDNSVSGRHAEILVDGAGALLRDLGSTNGTRVGGERVIETRLSHGDRVLFGNVQLVFIDASAGEVPAAAAAPAGAPAAPTADALLRVSPEVLARSRKRSVVGLFGLIALVGAAAGLWFYLGRSSHGGESVVRPARPAPDNLLGEDFSFENETDGWRAAEGAPAAFLKSAQGRFSGAMGLYCDLSEGAWALHRSREVHAEAGRETIAAARVRVEGQAVAQIGIEFSPTEGPDAPGSVIAWSKPREAGSDLQAFGLSAVVPPAYETVRVVLLGRSQRGGSVAIDDVALVVRDSTRGPPLSVGDWHLALLGDPPAAAVLSRFGRALVSGLSFAEGSALPASAQAGGLTATARPGRIAIGSPQRAALCLRAEAPLARAGLATIGAEGYSAHGLDFERDGVTSLLLGKGGELVRLAFAQPVSLKGVADGPASRIQVRSGSGSELKELALQLDFAEERRKAGDLAYAARNAEKKGDLGECLKQWADLLNGYPYEEQLVAEAEAKRASLVQQGLSELQGVHAEIERARFFRLVDLYRQCRQKALAVGARFRGSEVDAEAQKVAAEVETDLAGLEADLAKTERTRLESILRVLESQKAAGLAAEVREHLQKLPQPPSDGGR